MERPRGLEPPRPGRDVWLLNAFSLNMISSFPAIVRFDEVSEAEVDFVVNHWPYRSGIGHEATAQVINNYLTRDVPVNRVNVTLEPGDLAIVAQVKLPRLAEGQLLTREQIAEAGLRFFAVKIGVPV